MSAGEPSSLFVDQLSKLAAAAQLGPIVDIACGRGRHTLAAARAGLPAMGLDRNAEALAELSAEALAAGLEVRTLLADLETGEGIPLAPVSCGAILVFRYLHRPIAAELAEALVPGGVLLYETFTVHQRELGYGPSRDEFLLQSGELPTLFPGLWVEHHWEGRVDTPKPAFIAQLAARRPG